VFFSSPKLGVNALSNFMHSPFQSIQLALCAKSLVENVARVSCESEGGIAGALRFAFCDLIRARRGLQGCWMCSGYNTSRWPFVAPCFQRHPRSSDRMAAWNRSTGLLTILTFQKEPNPGDTAILFASSHAGGVVSDQDSQATDLPLSQLMFKQEALV
jgi:hypothetical protein